MELSTLTTPLSIFAAEVCVVTIGTLRIIFVSRGQKVLAPILGFFEILIWLFAMSQIMLNLSDWSCYLAFALGFTLGNWLGIAIEKWLAMGTVIVRIITHRDAALLIENMRAANFGVTAIEGTGKTGKVQIIMTVVKRKQLPEVIGLIETHHPGAFFAVDDLQSARDGIFAKPQTRPSIVPLPMAKALQ